MFFSIVYIACQNIQGVLIIVHGEEMFEPVDYGYTRLYVMQIAQKVDDNVVDRLADAIQVRIIFFMGAGFYDLWDEFWEKVGDFDLLG